MRSERLIFIILRGPLWYYAFSLLFFNHTATTEIYTLSLHDALPIFASKCDGWSSPCTTHQGCARMPGASDTPAGRIRSEEHTSELQSHSDLVCRLLLEKKKLVRIEAATPSRGGNDVVATARWTAIER